MNENTKLTYHGAGRFIMGVPARNLSDYDLETVSRKLDLTVDELVEMLCESGAYKRTDLYTCAECGKVSKTWKAMSKHELEHIEAIQETITLNKRSDEEQNTYLKTRRAAKIEAQETNTTEVKTGEEQDNG